LTGLRASNTESLTTVTREISDSLHDKIRKAITRRKETFSTLARRALRRELDAHEVNFAQLARPHCGMFAGPPDLSSREGYGNKNDR